MKKKIVIVALALFLAFSGVAVATSYYNWGQTDLMPLLAYVFDTSLGHNHDGTNSRALGTQTGDITFRSTLLANGRVAASTALASSSTALVPAGLPYCVVLKNVGGAAGEATSLANGKPGQVLTFIITGLQPSGTWVVTPLTCTGFTSITFDTKGDTATLLYVNDTIGWIVQSNGGCTITQV